MKQTAVEWLVEQMKDNRFLSAFEKEIQQSKEMEKQQIENAFDDGWNRANETKHQAYTTLEDYGSNYYNKTFNN